MVRLFPRIWRNAWSYDGEPPRCYVRRRHVWHTAFFASRFHYDWSWRNARRLLPGVWWTYGQPFLYGEEGFAQGRKP